MFLIYFSCFNVNKNSQLWKENIPDVFSAHLYVTDASLNNDCEKHCEVPLLVQRCKMHFQRPNFNKILGDKANRHPK